MGPVLTGRRVAIIATDGVEESELLDPWAALEDSGASVDLISIKSGEIQAMRHSEKGRRFPVDCVVADVKASSYDALVIPGGVANPDRLRTDADAVRFVREFLESDKLVAAICHGPWLLVEAGGVKGRTLTSWPSLQTDIRNAGGEWVDRAVQVDQKLITSRKPEDLPQFTARLVQGLAREIQDAQVDRVVEQSFPASDPPPGPRPGGAGAGAESEQRI